MFESGDEIVRPRFDSKIVPETTKENKRNYVYDSSTKNHTQRSTFFSENPRIYAQTTQNKDFYNQNTYTSSGKPQQGYAALRNKYNLKIE